LVYSRLRLQMLKILFIRYSSKNEEVLELQKD
jgi:hypothetical protein